MFAADKNLNWTWANLVSAEHSSRKIVVFIKGLLLWLMILFTTMINNSACAILPGSRFLSFFNLMCNCGFLWSLGAGSLSWVFSFFKEGFRDSWQCAIGGAHIHQACWRLENSSEMAGGVQHAHSRPLPTHTHWQWRVVYNIYRHKHNRSSWSRPQAVRPPTEPHTVKSIGKREANTVIFTYILGVFQSHQEHQELHFWHWSFHFEEHSGTKRESVIVWYFNGWGHHSSSLCPPSDATWCLTRSAHLH